MSRQFFRTCRKFTPAGCRPGRLALYRAGPHNPGGVWGSIRDYGRANEAPRGKKSRFKGVYPRGEKWYAVFKHKGKAYYLGTFDDDVEAAKARDRKAYELEGEFAYLNFPEEILGKGKAAFRRNRSGHSRKKRKK